MEKYFDVGFMFVGLAFFIFIIQTVRHDENVFYQRKLTEAREFGFKNSRLRKKEKTKPAKK